MANRPRVHELAKIEYVTGSPQYTSQVVEREERQLLPWANDFDGTYDSVYFSTSRDVVGKLALPYIINMLQRTAQSIRVLEIGGGEGKAILYLLQQLQAEVPVLPTVFFTMTSLTSMPEHQDLINQVELKVPQIAEELPREWATSFDVVMTSAVLGWANPYAAIPEIKRVLKPKGYWFGLEGYGCRPLVINEGFQSLIPRIMASHQMANIISYKDYYYWKKQEEKFAVMYQKE